MKHNLIKFARSMIDFVISQKDAIPRPRILTQRQVPVNATEEISFFPQENKKYIFFGPDILISARIEYSHNKLSEDDIKCLREFYRIEAKAESVTFNLCITLLHEKTNIYHSMSQVEFMEKIRKLVDIYQLDHQKRHGHNTKFTRISVQTKLLKKVPRQIWKSKEQHLLDVIDGSEGHQVYFDFYDDDDNEHCRRGVWLESQLRPLSFKNKLKQCSAKAISFFICPNLGARIEDGEELLGFHQGMIFDFFERHITAERKQHARRLMREMEKIIHPDCVFLYRCEYSSNFPSEIKFMPCVLSTYNTLRLYIPEKNFYNLEVRYSYDINGTELNRYRIIHWENMVRVAEKQVGEFLSTMARIKFVEKNMKDKLPISCIKTLIFDLVQGRADNA